MSFLKDKWYFPIFAALTEMFLPPLFRFNNSIPHHFFGAGCDLGACRIKLKVVTKLNLLLWDKFSLPFLPPPSSPSSPVRESRWKCSRKKPSGIFFAHLCISFSPFVSFIHFGCWELIDILLVNMRTNTLLSPSGLDSDHLQIAPDTCWW